MRLKSIARQGLKGGTVAHDFSSPLVIVEGPNGSGKSTIAEALAFLRGEPVGGAAVDGPGLMGLLGDPGGVAVSAVFEHDGQLINVRRSRLLDAGSLKRSRVTLNNVEVDNEKLLSATVCGGTPASIMDLSPDRMRATLAMLGGGGDDIAVEREAARERLARARAAEQAARAACETSRQAAPERAIRPEEIAEAEQQLAAAQAERGAWAVKLVELEAKVAAASTAWAAHSAREKDLAAEIEALERRLAAPITQAPSAEDLQRAESALEDAQAVLAAAREDAQAANTSWKLAQREVDVAESTLAHVRGGTCPTCGQATQGMIPELEAKLENARAFEDGLREDHETAASWAHDAAEDLPRLSKAVVSMRAAQASQNLRSAADTVASHRLATLKQQVHEHRATFGNADAMKKELEAHLAAPPPETGTLQARVRKLGEERAAVLRWQSDLETRETAEAETSVASKHFDSVRKKEAMLVAGGAQRIIDAASPFAPPGNEIVYMDIAGTFGLRDLVSQVAWYGPGLSAGQRKMLDLALVVAMHEVMPTPGLRALVVDDADQLSEGTMTALRDACELAVDLDQLDFVLITTCHPQPIRPRWQRIAMGVDLFAAPGPVDLVSFGDPGTAELAAFIDHHAADHSPLLIPPAELAAMTEPAYSVPPAVAEKFRAWDAEAAAAVDAEPQPAIEATHTVMAACICKASPCLVCNGTHTQVVSAGQPRDFGREVNLYRLRTVVKNLGPADREALRGPDYAPPQEAASLFVAGLLQANGRRSVAGELAWDFLVNGKASDENGLTLDLNGPDRPPPPDGAGLTVDEAKRVIRATGAGTAALRHIASQGGEDHSKSVAQTCIVLIAQRAYSAGMQKVELESLIAAATELFPKSTRGKGAASVDSSGDEG